MYAQVSQELGYEYSTLPRGEEQQAAECTAIGCLVAQCFVKMLSPALQMAH
jgi:hypothetical protein